MGRVELKRKSTAFTNKNCSYYPCHNMDGEINCCFCCCPLYRSDCGKYGGTPGYTQSGIKDCSNCIFPHKYENEETMWDAVSKELRGDCNDNSRIRP